MLENLVLIMIAVFVIHKLVKTLGKEDDESFSEPTNISIIKDIEKNIKKMQEQEASDANYEIISALEASLPEKIKESIAKIRGIDKSFNIHNFINGAKKAFEIILGAFSSNDQDTLKKMLSEKVYENFNNAIESRIARNEKEEVTIVSIKNITVLDASLESNLAEIKVKIESEQIKVIKDAQGKIISGSLSKILNFEDTWKFSKKIGGSSSIWKLVEAT